MKKGEETRQFILQEVLALASTVGFGGLTIVKIAKLVGLSKAGLFAHFNSKENLQIAVMKFASKHFQRKVITPPMKGKSSELRIRILFNKWIEWMNSDLLPGGCPMIPATSEFDGKPGPVKEYLLQMQEQSFGFLSSLASSAKEERYFRPDIDANLFAFEIHSLILGYHLYSRFSNDPQIDNRCNSAFEHLLANYR